MSNHFQSIGTAAQHLFTALGREPGRIGQEATRHIAESIDSVTKAVVQGGFGGGLLAAADEFSPGNLVAGVVDAFIPGRDLPQPIADGISAGANALLASLVPGVGPVLGVLALVDAFQALSGATAKKPTERPQRPQTPDRPSHHGRSTPTPKGVAAPERLQIDIDVIRGGSASHLGWCAGQELPLDHPGVPGVGVDDPSRAGRRRLAQLERDLRAADAEIDRVLMNPHLCFEDMVFMLMKALLRQSQLEVKLELQTEKNSRDLARRAERDERRALHASELELAHGREKATGMKDGKKKNDKLASLSTRQTALNARREEFTARVSESTESRQERFEELKQAMQKLSEMEQALSNILNAMHQNAMNTIGNIR
jgi:hypothetical protein